MAMNLIVAYDMSNDDSRARMAAMLGGYGVRIQRSVYNCVVDDEELVELRRRAELLINFETDVWHAFVLCEGCRSQRIELGQVNRTMESLYWIV